MTSGPSGSKRRPVRAADALCGALVELGTAHVFGLPGSQNLELTEALRRSELRWVVPSNELAAAFMANGYYRSSGRPGVLLTIPGPGFTWALTGLAEARLDSAALLCLTGVHADEDTASGPSRRLQEIAQARMAEPVLKEAFRVASADELAATAGRAYRSTTEGEPGPVLVEIEHPVWSAASPRLELERAGEVRPDPEAVEAVARRLDGSRRPLLFVGQGGQEGAGALRRLAEALDAPVLVTTSGRGAIPDGHRLAVPLDRAADPEVVARDLIERSDLVLVLGSGLSHNATLGFRLELPAEKLVRVDASAEVLNRQAHPASVAVQADVPGLLVALLERGEAWRSQAERWPDRAGRSEALYGSDRAGEESEPRLHGGESMAEFFDALRRTMPEDACLVTDSGLHQMLARRHFRVDMPRTLVIPTNFQSMGFGVPAAIGAALARPGGRAVALVGDGGIRLSAFELATARALDVDLTVVVFVDGYFGLIRLGQVSAFGRGSGVELPELDLAGLCASLGVEHHALDRDPETALARCLGADGVHLLEVPLEDPDGLWREATEAWVREEVRRGLGPAQVERLRRWRERWRGWRGRSSGE